MKCIFWMIFDMVVEVDVVFDFDFVVICLDGLVLMVWIIEYVLWIVFFDMFVLFVILIDDFEVVFLEVIDVWFCMVFVFIKSNGDDIVLLVLLMMM